MACSALQAEGAYTKLGTWAPTEADAELIELMADKDEEWEASLKGKSEWLNRPAQPPGLLRSGAASCRATWPLLWRLGSLEPVAGLIMGLLGCVHAVPRPLEGAMNPLPKAAGQASTAALGGQESCAGQLA